MELNGNYGTFITPPLSYNVIKEQSLREFSLQRQNYENSLCYVRFRFIKALDLCAFELAVDYCIVKSG